MTYIHQRPKWPDLVWDAGELTARLAGVRHKQGRLLGRMEQVGFELRVEASLTTLVSDVVKSSAIEGEVLNPDQVRSSIAKRLGLDAGGLPEAERDVDGIVDVMLDATQQFDGPLRRERLFGWHAALFPTGRAGLRRIAVGSWRPMGSDPMQVVSGPIGKERVHYEAPTTDRLDAEMGAFLDWFESSAVVDSVLRAGVAHFWFVTIHPFEDGNGRIARAIADLALARSDQSKERFYSMSTQIELERKEYYAQLERAQRGDVEITAWLAWFLGCLERAIDAADGSLTAVLGKARLWDQINRKPVNERQRKVINLLLGNFVGVLTTSKYAKLTKCSADTALRDISALLRRRVLEQNEGGGRSTSYRLGVAELVRE